LNIKVFPFYKQQDAKDCGPTCLKIIAKHYQKTISIQQLRSLGQTTRVGSSLLGLSNASEALGFRSLGVKLSLQSLREVPLPCILHWNKNHYAVLYKIRANTFHISDPAHGLLNYSKKEFLKHWIGNNASEQTQEGIALLLEPTAKFYDSEFDEDKTDFGFKFLSRYLFKYKSFFTII
jgi:ATP-binding cassette subfamily B protein